MTQDFRKDCMQVVLPRIIISILPIYSLIYFIFHLNFFYDIKIIIQNVQVTENKRKRFASWKYARFLMKQI